MGKRPIFSTGGKRNTDSGYEHNGLSDGRLAVRPLVTENERRGGKPQRETNAEDAGKRLTVKLSFNLYSCILHGDSLVCKTRRGIVCVGHKRCMHVVCNFMEVAIFVLIVTTT